MGVPAFFAWLIRKYPEALTDLPNANAVDEGDTLDSHSASAKMLAEWRCDNLYLDMNGIIHPW